MKKSLKKRSKRLSTRDRVKQEKKKREFDRKVRHDKKVHPEKYTKSKKDPGVPNLCPFKEQVLQEAQEARDRKVAEKEARRKALADKKATEKEEALKNGGVQDLALKAMEKSGKFEILSPSSDYSTLKRENELKNYYSDFLMVLEESDVILQILDARDPLGSRCTQVEHKIVAHEKRMILLLNKADLVPRDNLKGWIQTLRKEFPTLPFKCSTQKQGKDLGRAKGMAGGHGPCLGADALMALLGNYSRNKDIKTSLRVGVVGLPNVGKSSLINSLKRSKACLSGGLAGLTRRNQTVQLDKRITLIDSPGLIKAAGDPDDADVALRNALNAASLSDPVTPVGAILRRCPKKTLMLQYQISEYDDLEHFLNLTAFKLGKLKKGGAPDREAAARVVLRDWNVGNIKYYTHPPEEEEKSCQIRSQIVAQFSKEFSLDDIDFDRMELDKMTNVMESDTVCIDSRGPCAKQDENEAMIQDDENKTGVVAKKSNKKKTDKKENEPIFKSEGNMKFKKMAKLRKKKEKKDRKRRDKVAADLSQGLESAFNTLID